MKEALILLVILIFLVIVESDTSSRLAISLPGCPDKCGNVSIPYPFGIGSHCAATSMNHYFTVSCDTKFKPPRPMIGDPASAVEVIDISLEHGEIRVYGGISYNCFTSNTTLSDNRTTGFSLENTPFIPSTTRNRFTVIGCNTLGIIGGYMHNNSDLYVAGCYSYCQGINSTSDGAPCTGTGCCETTISPNLTDFSAQLIEQSSMWNFNPCFYAMLVEVGWYSFRKKDLVGRLGFINEKAARGVPVVGDWAIRNGTCPEDGARTPKDYACVSSNSYCVTASHGRGYLCNCSKGYEGNPYLLNGCQGKVFAKLSMLVYEFVSNGTLFELLHDAKQRSPIPLDLRLNIATQSAEALAYIHSSTSRTILHGDVKSLNVLLDNEYNAKLSDFGASALHTVVSPEQALGFTGQ